MHLILRRLRDLVRAEDGFTMVAVMGVLIVVTGFSIAAFATTRGDMRPSLADRERKQAYAAAEAGVSDYLARLVADPEYWKNCATDANNPALNQAWNGSGADPRQWVNVPGSDGQFTIEVLPANGAATCDANNASATFIDNATGTFRIRSTGRAHASAPIKRSIIATFKRKGFIDYIYYTDYETQDPVWYKRNAGGYVTKEDPPGGGNPPTQRDVVTWGQQQCVKYWRDGRGNERFEGHDENLAGRLTGSNPNQKSSWDDFSTECGEIQFYASGGAQDKINGPFHTNDEILVCGYPHFGRYPSDDIEVSGMGPGGNGEGWRLNCGSGAPIVNQPGESEPDRGTWRKNAPLVTLPPSNASLKQDALPAYRFVGKTTIVLNGNSMSVNGKRENGQQVNGTIPLPTDGVIYVGNDDNGAPCPGYDPLNPYGAPSSCGDAWVSGNYNKNITITAENDIVINEDITRTNNADVMLGLISDDWIRVYHPTNNCNNTTSALSPLTIQAAILSVKHSFTVDTYWCGDELGLLNVDGAIAQKFRGPVGTSGGGGKTGYIKNYTYDNRLKFRSPPKFLDPIQSAWKLRSQVEQVPAT